MKNLPTTKLIASTSTYTKVSEGQLENTYKPLKNLQKTTGEIDFFRTNELNYNINNPVNIETQPSYDGSVNLIINDDKNPPILINSRFSINEDNSFSITDHSGDKDTNLYLEGQIELDSRLYKTTSKIPKIVYEGLGTNGKLKVGAYHFYFKYSDADGNETDFIGESGLVICHIGNINNPKSIRMGIMNEDSKKSVKFTISNLDTQYDYLKVYYTRTTSDNSGQDITSAHQIDFNFLIKSSSLNLEITGFNNESDVSLDDINPFYLLVDSVKTQAQCQNMLFFGNIEKPKIPYAELSDLSLRIIPSVTNDINIGNVDHNYIDRSGNNLWEYYNTKNIYNHLGYWPEEYYRFGIVYILNDFTLSPVFNVRGIDLNNNPQATEFNIYTSNLDSSGNPERSFINYDEIGYLTKTNNLENNKGVIRLPKIEVISNEGTKPIGITFSFQDKDNLLTELKKYTKGFFFVRQERVPTILTQGCVIGKLNKDYGNIPAVVVNEQAKLESFLNSDKELKSTFLTSDKFEYKAMICPDAELREPLFNQLFTSSEYVLTKALEQAYPSLRIQEVVNSSPAHFKVERNSKVNSESLITSKLTMVNDSMKLTTNGKDLFSARAGEAEQVWDLVDVINDWTKVPASTINSANSFVRGNFGTYVGLSDGTLKAADIINVRPQGFSNTSNYNKLMFESRFDNNSTYQAITDRLELNSDPVLAYRGDCFIGNFTHRIHRNFTDPELPTNDKIIDISTWKKNFSVTQESSNTSGNETTYVNRVLIEYKQKGNGTIYEPDDAKYPTLGQGLFDGAETDYKIKGCSKINRIDVNSVGLGHWITFKTMSNVNVSMRDINKMEIEEQTLIGNSRGFHPFYQMNVSSSFKLPESNIINGAANVTLSNRVNFINPDIPFTKNKFDTRIIYSDIHITDAFTNGFRIFRGNHYNDLPKTYGALTSLKEFSGNLLAVMENGIFLVPVNERLVAAEGDGGNTYINTSKVLPDNPRVISTTFGSTWPESVLETINTVYGVDTVARKIWKYDGNNFEIISDLKVQKFLNDNINLRESDRIVTIGLKNVKTHYNAFKGDIMFTFYNNDKVWNLCYNEKLNKFITFYSWCPVYSENINNIFFSFDLNGVKQNENYLWKHGQAGIYDLQGEIKPTTWYNKIEPFEFEFIVSHIPTAEKIFDNLFLISNKSKPSEFEFEIVGESYDWFNYKQLISDLNDFSITRVDGILMPENNNFSDEELLKQRYETFLINKPEYKKLPFIRHFRKSENTTNVWLKKDKLLSENRINSNQQGIDIKKSGRIRGNMQYLEDFWNVEIKPINFEYAYIVNNQIQFTKIKQHKIKDKYVKIRVKYSGEDLTIIQGLKTIFTISYA